MLKILFWPIRMLWALVTTIVNAIGILMGIVVGLGLIGLGVLFAATFVGLFIGVPMVILGTFILARAIF